MMQSAANHSPRSSSLLNRELTGNFGVFGSKMLLARVEKGRLYKGFSANSLLNGTGNNNPRTGNFFGGTGNFQGGAGNLSKPHFCCRAKFESAKGVGPSRRLVEEGLITPQNDCSPSPWAGEQECAYHLGTAHARRVTIGQHSLPTRATKQPDQTLLLDEHVSPWVAEVVLSVIGNRSDRRFPNRPVPGPSRPLR